jgi:hypothetical protein
MEPVSLNFFANTEETETFYLVEPNEANRRGFYVKVKTRLSWGERKRLDSAAVTSMSTEQRQAAANGQAVDGAEQEEVARTMTYGLNLFVPNFLKLACYIVEWNLIAADGSTVRLPRQIDEKARLMERLDADIGDRIAAFIDGMVDGQQKALEAAKAKDGDGETLNGTVLSAGSRRLEEDEDPTTPPAGNLVSGGSRRK